MRSHFCATEGEMAAWQMCITVGIAISAKAVTSEAFTVTEQEHDSSTL